MYPQSVVVIIFKTKIAVTWDLSHSSHSTGTGWGGIVKPICAMVRPWYVWYDRPFSGHTGNPNAMDRVSYPPIFVDKAYPSNLTMAPILAYTLHSGNLT